MTRRRRKSKSENGGLATGNRLAVIDIDVDEAKGKNGMDALKDWEESPEDTLKF